MNDATAPGRSLVAQELIWSLGSLLAGLLLVPAMVYLVGSRMFGAYKGSGAIAGLSGFYSDYARDLGSLHLTAWTLALGPIVLVYAIRLILGHLNFRFSWLRKRLNNPDESITP